MREILFRGKRVDNGEWVQGSLFAEGTRFEIVRGTCNTVGIEGVEVVPETIGQYTALTDKNGAKIFEGDIVQYITYDDFDCQSVVMFGEYKQDGSGGEYGARKCVGFYVMVDNFTCPDWCEDEPEYFPYHMWQQNILEVASTCEIIGNIHDNPELLKV